MSVQIIEGDCRTVLPTLPAASVHCCITSPPYWGLRDYGLGPDCFGLEPTIELYVQHSVEIFREVRRVLRDDGTLWLNLGDSYAGGGNGGGGSFAKDGIRCAEPGTDKNKAMRYGARGVGGVLKPKDLCMIPARVALALQADGWWLRSEIIWNKPNPMPESVTDRPTSSHEKIFLLAKSAKYYYDADAVREPFADERNGASGVRPGVAESHAEQAGRGGDQGLAKFRGTPGTGRNLRNVWTFATEPFPEAHFATYPTELVKRCILAGCPKGGTVLDPFGGSGTTGLVADRLERSAMLIEANLDYVEMAQRRIASDAPLFASSPAPQGAAGP